MLSQTTNDQNQCSPQPQELDTPPDTPNAKVRGKKDDPTFRLGRPHISLIRTTMEGARDQLRVKRLVHRQPLLNDTLSLLQQD